MPLEANGSSLRLKYGYDLLSSPDSEDCMKKMLYGGAYGIYFGTTAGLLESLVKLKSFTPTTIGFKILGWAGPLSAIGVAYPTMTCTLANMRGKDDVVNHGIGGLISGSIYGIRYKKPWVAYVGAITFGIFCALNKYCHKEGIKFYSDEIYNVPTANAQFNHYERSFLATRGPILGNQDQ